MFWFLIILLFALVLLILSVKTFIAGNDDFWPNHGIPFVPSAEMASFWEWMTNTNHFHLMDYRAYLKIKSFGEGIKFGGIMELRSPVAFITDLDLLRSIMVKDFDHFVNRRPFGRTDDPTMIHKMLVAMNNAEWKAMRAALSPTFTTGKIRQVFDIFGDSSTKLEAYLENQARNSGSNEVDMRQACGKYTMDVIASAVFGIDSQNFNQANSMFAQMGTRFQNHLAGMMGAIRQNCALKAPALFKLLGLTMLDQEAFNFFRGIVVRTIRHRDETGEKRKDFLQLILEARNGTLKAESESEPKDEVMTPNPGQKLEKIAWTDELIAAQAVLFIFGGFDTNESLLSFAVYELALNQDVQERLFQEIQSAVEENGDLSYEVVNHLVYLDMVVSELLRIHSPAVRVERICTKDYQVPDSSFVIKKGTTVAIPIWSIHHDPDIYPEPHKFVPERFAAKETVKRHAYAYMPFGVGPRHCIAQRFAIAEGKAALAHLVHKFLLEPCARTPIPLRYQGSPVGTLKPMDDIWLKVTTRN